MSLSFVISNGLSESEINSSSEHPASASEHCSFINDFPCCLGGSDVEQELHSPLVSLDFVGQAKCCLAIGL